MKNNEDSHVYRGRVVHFNNQSVSVLDNPPTPTASQTNNAAALNEQNKIGNGKTEMRGRVVNLIKQFFTPLPVQAVLELYESQLSYSRGRKGWSHLKFLEFEVRSVFVTREKQ